MDDVQQDRNNAESEEQEQMDVAGIFRCIFCSCDVDNTDLVPVSKLIEFVQPFMLEDLNALEDLRHSLDPEGKNVLVSSERFYQVIGQWSQKLAGTSSQEENDFSRSPSKLTVIDDKELPYTHSTPRASLGEKLLRCKDLLNLSNVSGYSLSTSRLDTTNPADLHNAVLEEEIKKLEHQLSKTANELTLTKQQLAASDEQNEQLQQDLDRLNKRLHAEQQVIEHLQKEKTVNEDLRDELSIFKKDIEELKKKLSQSEKDSIYHRDLVNELDQEKLKLEKKNEVLSRQNQDCLKEIFDIKTELETKEQQVTDIKKVYDELKSKFAEQKDFIDQLREENDILNHQKSTLEKAMKAKSLASPHSNLGNLNFDFSKTPSPPHSSPNSHTPYLASPNLSHQNRIQPKCHSGPLLRRVLNRQSSTPIQNTDSLLDVSVPDSVKSLPVLSPVFRTSQVDDDQRQDSSEEDLSWKFQGELRLEQSLNGTVESLQTEMHMADPARISETYHTALFEKDEQIIELEEELERIKRYLKEIEDQKNELVTKLKEQKEMNEELLETNYKLLSKEEFTQNKIESLKNKITQLERNGIIVENEHENSQGEVEDLKNKIKTLEAALNSNEIIITDLKARSDSVISLQEEVTSLKKDLEKANNLISDYDEKLQAAMRDLGKESAEKISLKEKMKDMEAKLGHEQQLNTDLSNNIDNLKIDNNSLKEELKCTVVKYETTLKNISQLEEKLFVLRDLLDNKDREMVRLQEDKQMMVNELEWKIKLKDEMLEDLKNGQKQKDNELKLFRENLENKLVREFEEKVKYSMDAEEKVLHLTQELNSLKTSNSKLELTVADLKSEQDEFSVKRQTMDKIDLVSTEIQKYIKEKNIVIEELKQLNKKMELNLNETHFDLRQKVDEILNLRNDCSKYIEINNDLWMKAKTLQNENDQINGKNKELIEKELQLLQSNEELQIEYNNLLVVYDMEVKKNAKLVKEVAQFIEEKNRYCDQYNELKKEFKNFVSKFNTEEQNNRNITLFLSELEAKIDDLELQNKKLQENVCQVQKKDIISQTEEKGTEIFEEEFSNIKLESDKILEELECKLNEEVDKNRNLTKDLLKMKNHLDESNTELLKIKQKITENETDMETKLQQNIESNRILMEELSKTKNIINNKNVRLLELTEHIKETEEKLKSLSERNITLNQEVSNKNKELETVKQLLEDREQVMQLNTELLKKYTDIEKLFKQKHLEIENTESINRQLISEMNISKQEKDKLNNDLCNANNENKRLLKELELRKEEKEKLNQELSDLALQITKLREIVSNLENEKSMLLTQQQSQIKELENAAFEIIQLKEKLTKSENKKSMQLEEAKQKLQEEMLKTKAIFNNYSLLKNERDQLSVSLNDIKIMLSDTTTLYKKKQTELKELQLNFSKLESEVQIQTNELAKLKEVIQQHRDEIAKKDLEKNQIFSDLLSAQSSLENANLKLKDLEMELLKSKKEIDIKCHENKSAMSDLNESKSKWSESLNDDSGAGSNNEKDMIKHKSYSRQQIALEKIRNKLEDTEHQLKLEKSRNQELKTQLSIVENRHIGNEEGHKKEIERLQEQLAAKIKCLELIEKKHLEKANDSPVIKEEINVKNEDLQDVNRKEENKSTELMFGDPEFSLVGNLEDEMEENKIKYEGKTINKFTLASRPASPDSPSLGIEVNGSAIPKKLFYTKYPYSIKCDTIIEIPSLDLTGFADDILEELELAQGSPGKKLDREETEKNITALTLRLLLTSNDISTRIENQTEKYRCQYEELLSLIRDISHRLRDHVCIGTDEPIMPVFVLLEDIKLTLKEVVQSAGQVGVLVYEDKMKKYWNLVTNYMAMLRQENESLRSVPRETTPTQTGSVRKRNKSTQDRGESSEQTAHSRRRFIPCIRLTVTLLFVLAFALTLSVIIQVNCRMTASENQYCPLDGVITRINMGVPPM